MADLRVTTISGVDTVLKETAVAAFKHSLRGPLIAPGDDRYEEAPQVWNGNIGCPDRSRSCPDGGDAVPTALYRRPRLAPGRRTDPAADRP